MIKVVVTVPESHANVLRKAIGNAGGGEIGNYSYCSFSVKGVGRFRPDSGASPFLGKEGELESVFEERIEFNCSKKNLKQVIQAIRKVHPYEEPVIDIYRLISESSL